MEMLMCYAITAWALYWIFRTLLKVLYCCFSFAVYMIAIWLTPESFGLQRGRRFG